MVKVFLRNHWKSIILEHFRAVKVKIFFNHGEIGPLVCVVCLSVCVECPYLTLTLPLVYFFLLFYLSVYLCLCGCLPVCLSVSLSACLCLSVSFVCVYVYVSLPYCVFFVCTRGKSLVKLAYVLVWDSFLAFGIVFFWI